MITPEQAEVWRAKLEAFVKAEHTKAYPTIRPEFIPSIALERGPKYTRIIKVDVSSRSAYGFIDNETGKLYKADGWKRPAKGARGDMLGADPLAGCTRHGMEYRR